jgi:hypothetical protein
VKVCWSILAPVCLRGNISQRSVTRPCIQVRTGTLYRL